MELFKRLREESLKRRLPISLLLLALGAAVFFAFSCFDLVKLAFPWTLAQLTPEQMEGVWLEDEVSYLHREYAREVTHQEGREDRLTGALYVISLDDEQYMGLYVHQDALDQAQTLMEASDACYNGQLAEDELPAMPVAGMVRAMDEGHAALFKAAAQGDGNVESVMLLYYVDMGRLNGRTLPAVWAALAASCALMAAGLAVGIFALAGGCQRKLKAKAAEAGDLAMSMSRVRGFYERTTPLGGVRADKNYVMFRKGATDILLRPWDVTWAYAQDRRGGSVKVVFRTARKGKYSLTMPQADAQLLFRHLEEQTPGILLGYTKGKARSYRCDPTFAKRWEAFWPGCTYKK